MFVSLHVNNVKRQERSEEVLEMGFVVRELMDILERGGHNGIRKVYY